MLFGDISHSKLLLGIFSDAGNPLVARLVALADDCLDVAGCDGVKVKIVESKTLGIVPLVFIIVAMYFERAIIHLLYLIE